MFFLTLLRLLACASSLPLDVHQLAARGLSDAPVPAPPNAPNAEEVQVARASELNFDTVQQLADKNRNLVVRLMDTNTYFVKNPYSGEGDEDDAIEMIETDFNSIKHEDKKTISVPITPCIHQNDHLSSVSVGTSFSSSLQIKPSIKGKAEVGLMVPFLMLPLSFSTTNKVTLQFSKSSEQAFECSAGKGESVVLIAEITVPKFKNIKQRIVKFTKHKTYVKPWKKIKAFMNPVSHFACSTTKVSNEFCFKPLIEDSLLLYSQSLSSAQFELDENYALEMTLPQGWTTL